MMNCKICLALAGFVKYGNEVAELVTLWRYFDHRWVGFKEGEDIINSKNSTTGNTTVKTESKTGGAISAFWRWLKDF